MKTSDNKKGSDIFGDLFMELATAIANCIFELVVFIIRKGVTPFVFFLFGKLINLKPNKTEVKPVDLKLLNKSFSGNLESNCIGWAFNEKRKFFEDELNSTRHTMLFGASGWGKSNLFRILIERYLRRGTPVVYIDPKNSLEDLQMFIKLCKFHDKKFYIFSDTYIGEGAVNLNPYRDEDVAQNVASLMSCFIWSESYYKARAQYFLLETFTYFNNQSIVPDLEKVKIYVKKEFGKDKDAAGLIANLESICMTRLGKRLSPSKERDCLTLTDIIEEGSYVYIGLNKSAFKEFARTVGKMFVDEVLMIAAYRSSNSLNPKNDYKPFALMTDETSSIIQADYLDLANKCRSSLIELVCAFQSISDLESVIEVKSFFKILVECFSNYFIFRQSDPENSELAAGLAGTYSSVKQTYQTDDDEETDKGSARDVEKYIVHPNIFKRMPLHTCIHISYGESLKLLFLLLRDTTDSEANKIKLAFPALEKMGNKSTSRKLKTDEFEEILKVKKVDSDGLFN